LIIIFTQALLLIGVLIPALMLISAPLASATTVPPRTPKGTGSPAVKYGQQKFGNILVGNVTKYIAVNSDGTMWKNTHFGSICFTPDSEGGKVLLSSHSPSLIGTSVCPAWLPEK
jgi:hypothetical protein